MTEISLERNLPSKRGKIGGIYCSCKFYHNKIMFAGIIKV